MDLLANTQQKSKSKLVSQPQTAQNTVLRLLIKLTKSVTYTYGKATLTWFEEIFEEYKSIVLNYN